MISKKGVKTVEEQIRMFKIVASRITDHASPPKEINHDKSSINHRHKRTRWSILGKIPFRLDKGYEVFGTYKRFLSAKKLFFVIINENKSKV